MFWLLGELPRGLHKGLRKTARPDQDKIQGKRPPAIWSIPDSRVMASGSSAQNKGGLSKSLRRWAGLTLGLADTGHPPVLYWGGRQVLDGSHISKIIAQSMEGDEQSLIHSRYSVQRSLIKRNEEVKYSL